MALPPIYKIHPAIGIARLGDASGFFIGSETPGLRPTGEPPGTKVPPYKDGGKIKPQAARFRVFEYVEKGGVYVVNREVSVAEKDVTKLVWTVHLANRKASFFQFNGLAGSDRPNAKGRRNEPLSKVDPRKLEIDPKERSISGKNAKPVEFSKGTSKNPATELWPDPRPSPEITTLGRLLTDGDGRLIVVGASGKTVSLPAAAPIGDYANNDGWFDDVSDGPVTVYIELKGKPVTVMPAWVICPPPDFAPHLTNVVTLYDLMYDVAAREAGTPGNLTIPANEVLYTTGARKGLAEVNKEFKKSGKPILSTYQPDFESEIYPILYRAAASMFLFKSAVGKHTTLIKWVKLASKDAKYLADRQAVLAWIREPDAKSSNSFPYMPKLLGDEPYPLPAGVIHQRVRLTVTPTQYALLQQWVKGNFIEPAVVPPSQPTKPNITPEGLDRAALENCVGGAFYPGIEVGWQSRSASIYTEPCRIKPGAPSPYLGDAGTVVKAGHLTRQMALPWQADFLQCKGEDDNSGVFPGLGLWGWWPAQRPDWVFASEADFTASPPKPAPWHRATKARKKVSWPTGFGGDPDVPSYQEMLDNWRKFGFIVEKKKNIFLEDEREADIP